MVIEEGWKSWRKYRLLALYKGDIQAHYVGRTLMIYPINKVHYMGPNGPHPRKYLSDNTVAYNTPPRSVNLIPQPYPSVVRLYFNSHLTSTSRPSSVLIYEVLAPKTYHLKRFTPKRSSPRRSLNTYQPTIYLSPMASSEFLLIHSLATKFSPILKDHMCVSYILLALSPLTNI